MVRPLVGATTLTRSPLETSLLGFGTSRLHYMSASARANILALAVDLGIRHIDTAPVYGDGLAERVIGEVFRRRRADIVLATKAGLPPHPIADAFPPLASIIRASRFAMRLAGLPQVRSQPITAHGLRSSLERSLRRMNVSYVDVFFVHEPAPDMIADPDAVLDALIKIRRDGLARHIGVAGEWTGIAALGDGFLSQSLLVQTHEDQWPPGCPPDITYGALSPGQQAFGRKVMLNPAQVRQRLQKALARRPSHTVLISTTDASRLRALSEAAVRTA